jgi:hypothetical protein
MAADRGTSCRRTRWQRKCAAAPKGNGARDTFRWLRGLEDCLFPAASADPGGRDQSLVRRTRATRHLEVRHWITSFPLLHLPSLMTSRASPVKGFRAPHRPRARRPSPGCGAAPTTTAVRKSSCRYIRESYPKGWLPSRSPTAHHAAEAAEIRHYPVTDRVALPTDICPISVAWLSDFCVTCRIDEPLARRSPPYASDPAAASGPQCRPPSETARARLPRFSIISFASTTPSRPPGHF